MELTITKKELNPLLFRVEIEAVVSNETTPSYAEVKEELAEQIGKDKELVVVRNVYQKYGMHESTVNASIYDNKESMDKFEGIKETKEGAETAEQKPAENKAEKKEE